MTNQTDEECLNFAIDYLHQKRKECRKDDVDYERIIQLNKLQRLEENKCGVRAVEVLDEYNIPDDWNGIRGLDYET